MSNASTATACATTLNPEQARTLFDHLLPTIVSSRALTRELIRNVADSKLGFQPIAGGESLSDLMWYLASAYDVFLNALCDAKFPDLPAKPQPASVDAFLDWDDNRFEQTVQRVKALSDADLLRPLSFGPFTQPAVEFMAMFIGNVAQHTGQLMMGLALANGEPTAIKTTSSDGELSDEELAGVAGGSAVVIEHNDFMPNITVTYNTPAVNMSGINEPLQATMGSTIQHANPMGLFAFFGGGALGTGAAAFAQFVMFGIVMRL